MKTLFLIAATVFLSTGLNVRAADGSAIFSKECSKCHGADGKGDTKMGKKLKIKDLTVEVGKLSDDKIASAVKDGVKEGDKLRMKPIKGLSDEDVQAVIKFVKTLKKQLQPSWLPAERIAGACFSRWANRACMQHRNIQPESCDE